MKAMQLLTLAAFLVAGFVVGLVYLGLLRRAVDQLIRGGDGLRAAGSSGLRLGAALALFLVAARFGAAALLLALLGFWLARQRALMATGHSSC